MKKPRQPRKKPAARPLRKLARKIDRRQSLTKADKRALEAMMPRIDPGGN